MTNERKRDNIIVTVILILILDRIIFWRDIMSFIINKPVVCAACGKTIISEKSVGLFKNYKSKDGKDLCEDCYNKALKKEEAKVAKSSKK